MTDAPLGPIAIDSIPRVVVERILGMIARGELKISEPLPTERELAETLGVSRIALREATQVLKVLGVIKSVRGRGTVLLPSAPYAQFEQLSLLLTLTPSAVLHMIEARRTLERGAVRLAADRATPDEITALRDSLERQRALVDDRHRFSQEDAHFHRTVVAAAHNPIFLQMLDGIGRQLEYGRLRTAQIPGRLAKAVVYHERLVEALAVRDAEKAVEAVSEHLDDLAADVHRLDIPQQDDEDADSQSTENLTPDGGRHT